MNAQELWQTALERLREQVQPATTDWFAETAAFSLVDDVLVVGVKSSFTAFYLARDYESAIHVILASIMERPIQVEYVSHFSLAKLFEEGELSPDLPSLKVARDLDVAKILILIEQKEEMYAACAPDVPQSYVTGSSREEVIQRLRKVIQERLSLPYDEYVPASLPHIAAEYLDLTHSE